jgi:uncharacterized protein (TIGR00255 family)
MLLSMTGYGKESFTISGKTCNIEIKAVNSKNLDLSTRIPSFLKGRDMELRKMISSYLIRGKIDFSISISNTEKEKKINENVAKEYYKEIHSLSKKLGIKENFDHLGHILKMPEIYNTPNDNLSDQDWKKIIHSTKKSLKELVEFRKQEGAFLGNDILARIDNMKSLMSEVSKFENERIINIRQRIKNNISKSLTTAKIDNDRLEQELIHYIEKLDITEERVRFNGHCKYFKKTALSKESNGKKLGFVAQELGREINTIGSKANHLEIQRIVVDLKDELEKIKEQLFNVL